MFICSNDRVEGIVLKMSFNLKMKYALEHSLRMILLLFFAFLVLPVSAKAETTVIAEGSCGEHASYVLTSDYIMTISGWGEIDNSGHLDAHPWETRKVIIESGITSIGKYAFQNCWNVSTYVFPKTLKSIGANAFWGNIALKNISIPSTVEYISKDAFNCVNYLKYTTYENCQYIGNADNPYLILMNGLDNTSTSVTIHENTKFIYDIAFRNYSALTQVSLPQHVTGISYRCFAGCTSLTTISLPADISYIGEKAFYDCKKLSSVQYAGSAADFADVELGTGVSFSGILQTDENHTHTWVAHHELASLTQDGGSWDECSTCHKKKNETIVFQIKEAILTPNEFVYNGSEQKPYIVIRDTDGGMVPPDNYTVAFSGDCTSIATHGITITFKNKYEGTINTSYSIKEEYFPSIPDGLYGDNISYSYYKGVLTLSGSGAMKDYFMIVGGHSYVRGYCTYDVPWYTERSYIRKVIVGEGITSISDYAFLDCNMLTEVQLPSTLKQIGYYAFYDCANLKTITLPESLQTIKNFAFYGCTELEDMTIPTQTVNIAARALEYAGDTATTTATTTLRHQAIMNYLNTVYLNEDCSLGYELYNVSEGDKVVMQALVDDLIKDCTTDQEKVDAIGNFAEKNLRYEAGYSDFSNDVFRHLKGVCAGHNQLTSSLLKLAGFPTAVLSGQLNSHPSLDDFYFGKQLSHQWVMTYFDDTWHIIDTTTNYVIHDADELTNFYVGFLVDGVMPTVDNEDFYKLSMIKTGANFYSYEFFNYYYFKDCFCVGGSTLHNNGAIWGGAIQQSFGLYNSDIVSYHAQEYFFHKNNGLATHGVYPNIDGKSYFWSEGTGIETTEAFAYHAYYQSAIYLTVGETLQILSSDLLGNTSGIGIKESRYTIQNASDVISIDMHGCITAQKPGRAEVVVTLDGHEQLLGISIQVVSSAAYIPTNSILQQYCTHEYTSNAYSNVTAATESAGGSYTCSEYCCYCGKLVKSYSVTTTAIGECTLSETAYSYDCKDHYPLVSVLDADGNPLQMYNDYYIEYEETSSSVGTHNATIHFINGYSGTKSLEYAINGTDVLGEWYAFDGTTGTLTISNTTSIDDYSTLSDRMWHSYREAINKVVLPNNLTSIGANAFADCTNLKTIVLPETLETISSGAFRGCTSLVSIEIPKTVTVLPSDLFSWCSGLKSVTFYDTVTSIGKDAFAQCSSLEWVFFDNLASVFENINVSTGNDALIEALLISTKGSGEVLASGKAGNTCTYVLTEDGRLSITGTGTAKSFILSAENAACVTKLYINEGITETDEVFRNSGTLKQLYLPKTLKTIGSYSFAGSTALEEVYCHEGITTIGSYAFNYCPLLETFTLPNSVTSIGNYAFQSCAKLNANLPGSLTAIGQAAFHSSGVTSIEVPKGITKIESYTFFGCKLLESIDFGTVTEIGSSAFYACTALTYLVLPDTLLTIADDAFGCASNSNMQYIYIPSTVENIAINGYHHFGPFSGRTGTIFLTNECNENWPSEWNYTKSNSVSPCTVYSDISKEDVPFILAGYQYHLYYNAGDGIGAPASQLKNYALDMTVSSTSPSRENFIFSGWATEANGDVVVEKGGTLPKTACLENDGIVILYACWEPVAITEIAITTAPSKTSYIEGETFNCSGMVVTAYYNNSTDTVVTSYTVLPSGELQMGDTKVTISYDGKNADQTITVIEKQITGISLKSAPTNTACLEGYDIVLSGGSITVSYDNGKSDEIAIDESMLSGYDCDTLGAQTVTVTYEGFTCTFDVTVVEDVNAVKYAASLSVKDSIDVNLYIYMSENILNAEAEMEKYTVESTFSGATKPATIIWSKDTEIYKGNAYYRGHAVVASVFAYEITKPVVINVYYSDGGSRENVKTINYSVQKYFKEMLQKDTADNDSGESFTLENRVNLYKSTLNYGSFSQLYFSGKEYDGGRYPTVSSNTELANTILDAADQTLKTTPQSMTRPDDFQETPPAISGITKIGRSLILGSEVSIKFNFYTTDCSTLDQFKKTYQITCYETADPSKTVDISKTYRVEGNGAFSIKVTHISAADFDKRFTVKVVKGNTTFNDVVFSVTDYAYLKRNASTALSNLCCAIMDYSNAANTLWPE